MPARDKLTYANVMSTIGIFVAIGGTTAFAVDGPNPGQNTVGSEDIIGNEVRSDDIGNGRIFNLDIADEVLTGQKLKNGSVTGADLAESTLGEVPNATIAGHGGYGRGSTDGGQHGPNCNPESSAFVTCAEVGLNPSAGGRALVIGRFRASSELDSSSGNGVCRLGVSTTGEIAGTSAPIGADDDTNSLEWVTLAGITDPLSPGSYTFGIDCNESGGGIAYSFSRVTAVMISPF